MRVVQSIALLLWVASLRHASAQETAGIGVALGVQEQYVIVKQILPDSPAAAQTALLPDR